jgi:general stress protein 26
MPKTYTKQEILDFLRKTSLMSAAFVRDGDKPLSTILLFAIDDDFTLYFATLKSSFKAKALEENNNISIAVWGEKEMLVQANGVVEQEKDLEKAERIVEKLADSAAGLDDFWPPVLQIKGHDYSVYKTKITWLHALDLTSTSLVENQSLFSEVDLQ